MRIIYGLTFLRGITNAGPHDSRAKDTVRGSRQSILVRAIKETPVVMPRLLHENHHHGGRGWAWDA